MRNEQRDKGKPPCLRQDGKGEEMQHITIDPEFKAMIPPLSASEFELLEASIIKEGCRDPLVVWGDMLIDGHNRYAICKKHGIAFETVSREFAGIDEAADWVDANQLGRRNLTPDQMSLIRGRRLNRLKSKKGAETKNGYQNDIQYTDIPKGPNRAARILAVQHGVSPATMSRDGRDAALIDQHPEKAKAIMNRETTKREVIQELTGNPSLRKDSIKTKSEPQKKEPTIWGRALDFATIAISHLTRIDVKDPQRVAALTEVIDYCQQQLNSKGV